MERLYTLLEAADALRLSENTIRRHIKAGRLPARKIGKVWRVAEPSLRALAGVETQTAEAAEKSAEVGAYDRANPLSQALAMAAALTPKVKAGTRGTMDAAADIEVNREERMRELDHIS